ncbi:tetratricopeptide repeat protein [candidate division KSB1 bacterium]
MKIKMISCILFLTGFTFLLFNCMGDTIRDDLLPELEDGTQAISLFGEKLKSPEPSAQILENLRKAEADLEADPDNVEMHIWYGRRMAYTGNYREAINIYTRAINKFPDDPRLYRHRGHRFISIRMFDSAIDDFNRAVRLIEGTDDEIEPDGMPNSRNIPVSSLHSNIWYHLGLAYYLKNDMENALFAYRKCRETSNNNDNVVSSSHWLYMILKRLGREDEAAQILEPINEDMDIIENMSYHRLLLFYKGVLTEKELLGTSEGGSAGAATMYGLGNWYFYTGDIDRARQIYRDLLKTPGWAAFGYIAAEADLKRMK